MLYYCSDWWLHVYWIHVLNPGQTGVLGADHPLYAIAKQLQWTFPESLGEDKLVVMLGALHIEDKVHQMTGKLLGDSGWTTVLSQAQVLTSGRAQSALNEHHIKRTRYAHQVSVISLHLLKYKAYSAYCSGVDGAPGSQEVWEQFSRTDNPQFKYWSTIMELELLMCRFIRSLREGTSQPMSKYVMSSVHGFMWWTIRIMQDGCLYTCGIWFSCQRHIRTYMPNFWKEILLSKNHHTSSASLARISHMNSPTRGYSHTVEQLGSMRIRKHSHSSCWQAQTAPGVWKSLKSS